MTLSLRGLKHYVSALVEAKVGASENYMRKERVREAIQQCLADLIASSVTTQEQLTELFDDVDISVKALKMIPFEVWEKL
jgi:hypothetical protein